MRLTQKWNNFREGNMTSRLITFKLDEIIDTLFRWKSVYIFRGNQIFIPSNFCMKVLQDSSMLHVNSCKILYIVWIFCLKFPCKRFEFSLFLKSLSACMDATCKFSLQVQLRRELIINEWTKRHFVETLIVLDRYIHTFFPSFSYNWKLI